MKKEATWRWTLGQVDGESFYQELEDMVDWSALGEKMRRRLIPSRVRKLLTVWVPTRKSLEQWRDDFKQGHTVTRGNLENDDAFSFFVESSFSGNGVVLNRARHDDIDDAYENMNNRFLDILRTSLMTCLLLLVCFRWGLCRLPEMMGLAWNKMNIIMNARRNHRTNSSLFRKTACILSQMSHTGRISIAARNGAGFVAILSAIWTLSDGQRRKHFDRGNDEHLSSLSRVFSKLWAR